MEELREALKAVERELKLTRRVYRATIFLYWAWAFPAIYLFSLVLEKYAGIQGDWIAGALSVFASVGFIVEEKKAFKRILQLEEVLGKSENVSRVHIVVQILVWPFSALTATLYTSETGLWILVFIGLGLLILAAIESLFRGSGDWRTALAGLILLGSTKMYNGMSYAVLMVSLTFSLTAYLNIKGSTRE